MNPLKGSEITGDCFAVSRTPIYGSGHVDACIGRSIQAHVVDQRGTDRLHISVFLTVRVVLYVVCEFPLYLTF